MQLTYDELGNATTPCGSGHAFVMVGGKAVCDPDPLQETLSALRHVITPAVSHPTLWASSNRDALVAVQH